MYGVFVANRAEPVDSCERKDSALAIAEYFSRAHRETVFVRDAANATVALYVDGISAFPPSDAAETHVWHFRKPSSKVWHAVVLPVVNEAREKGQGVPLSLPGTSLCGIAAADAWLFWSWPDHYVGEQPLRVCKRCERALHPKLTQSQFNARWAKGGF